MMLGMIQSAPGACPVCGRDVNHTLRFSAGVLTDTYGCYLCGETTYRVAPGAYAG